MNMQMDLPAVSRTEMQGLAGSAHPDSSSVTFTDTPFAARLDPDPGDRPRYSTHADPSVMVARGAPLPG